ncbi:DUF4244 domain-containing protein [Streptomyces sp. NK15101]|uniref:DUF4244 domain-containing protein n=1 Tax=Streptomyces sp. NK15101 TaxID=2873261 RepID=UPI001CEDD2F8|nr:DUF4244 domain-containing protein [Streptomyces sp. NK15101]
MTHHGEARQDEAGRSGEVGVALKERLCGWWRVRRTAARRDEGMTTSEYAVGTIAAAAFAAVLYKIVTSGAVSGALESVIGKALDAPF